MSCRLCLLFLIIAGILIFETSCKKKKKDEDEEPDPDDDGEEDDEDEEQDDEKEEEDDDERKSRKKKLKEKKKRKKEKEEEEEDEEEPTEKPKKKDKKKKKEDKPPPGAPGSGRPKKSEPGAPGASGSGESGQKGQMAGEQTKSDEYSCAPELVEKMDKFMTKYSPIAVQGKCKKMPETEDEISDWCDNVDTAKQEFFDSIKQCSPNNPAIQGTAQRMGEDVASTARNYCKERKSFAENAAAANKAFSANCKCTNQFHLEYENAIRIYVNQMHTPGVVHMLPYLIQGCCVFQTFQTCLERGNKDKGQWLSKMVANHYEKAIKYYCYFFGPNAPYCQYVQKPGQQDTHRNDTIFDLTVHLLGYFNDIPPRDAMVDIIKTKLKKDIQKPLKGLGKK